MKKSGVLNSNLSRLIAAMGHTDKLVICDSGLPIPKNADVVDLALSKNIPRFLDALKVILQELQIEEAIIAQEMEKENDQLYKKVIENLPKIRIKKVTHEQFKNLIFNENNISFVRTGEATPFANIILVSGVIFE